MALAIVSALLASLAEKYLLGNVTENMQGVAHAAQQIAAGDLVHASVVLPDVARDTLIASYN